MPDYDKEHEELTFSREESEANHCPIDGAGLDFGALEVLDEVVKYPWNCPECHASGAEYAKMVFDGHVVDIHSLPPDLQRKYSGADPETDCINGPLVVGDLAMITDDATPCLVGVVTAIVTAGSEEGADFDIDAVTLDCRNAYGETQKEQIAWWFADKAGTYKYSPFDTLNLSSVVIGADLVLRINGIGSDKLRAVLESEENALRYAYSVLRGALASDCSE